MNKCFKRYDFLILEQIRKLKYIKQFLTISVLESYKGRQILNEDIKDTVF
jgi:hypothetical protein